MQTSLRYKSQEKVYESFRFIKWKQKRQFLKKQLNRYTNKKGFIHLFALFCFLFSSISSTAQWHPVSKITIPLENVTDFKTNMNKLWEDNMVWTRNLIFCITDDIKGKDEVLKRLNKNQVEIGTAFKSFYGDEAGKKLSLLIKSYNSCAAEMFIAAKAGNASGLNEAKNKWYANAESITNLLSQLNPLWSDGNLKIVLNDYVKLTIEEASQRLNKNYDGDVLAYENLHDAGIADVALTGHIFGNAACKEIAPQLITPHHAGGGIAHGGQAFKLKGEVGGEVFRRGAIIAGFRWQQQARFQISKPCGHHQIIGGEFNA